MHLAIVMSKGHFDLKPRMLRSGSLNIAAKNTAKGSTSKQDSDGQILEPQKRVEGFPIPCIARKEHHHQQPEFVWNFFAALHLTVLLRELKFLFF